MGAQAHGEHCMCTSQRALPFCAWGQQLSATPPTQNAPLTNDGKIASNSKLLLASSRGQDKVLYHACVRDCVKMRNAWLLLAWALNGKQKQLSSLQSTLA